MCFSLSVTTSTTSTTVSSSSSSIPLPLPRAGISEQQGRCGTRCCCPAWERALTAGGRDSSCSQLTGGDGMCFLPASTHSHGCSFPQIQVLRWVLSINLKGSFTREAITRWFQITALRSTDTSCSSLSHSHTWVTERLFSKAQENFSYYPSLLKQSVSSQVYWAEKYGGRKGQRKKVI